MGTTITLALAEAHVLVRKGLIALLKDFEDIQVIVEASGGAELLDQMGFRQPDIVLLDVDMLRPGDGWVMDELKDKYPQAKLVILSIHSDDIQLVNLLERGAKGVLQKDADVEVLVSAIRQVARNGYFLDPQVSVAVARKILDVGQASYVPQPERLSQKEIEIVRLICMEYSNKEIAEKLFLSPRTIDTYREKIMQKIGAKNTAGVVVYAFKHDLIKKE